MKKYRMFKAIKFLVLIALAVVVFGYVTMHLWNWLMPGLVGAHTVTFVQALGLLILSKILFGGFHRHGGGRGWRRHMNERWARMSPEEREKFRAGMRGRRNCGWNPAEEPAPQAGNAGL